MTTSAPTDLDEPPADAPRFLRAFWRLVRWALPVAFRYFGTYEYRIATVYAGPVLDLQATADTVAMGLADIPKVPAWPGVAGAQIGATAGARVLVQFINGNAARPIVVAWAPNGDSGWTPVGLTIDVNVASGVTPPPVPAGKITLGAIAPLPLVVSVDASWFVQINSSVSAMATALGSTGVPVASGAAKMLNPPVVPSSPTPSVADKAQASHL